MAGSTHGKGKGRHDRGDAQRSQRDTSATRKPGHADRVDVRTPRYLLAARYGRQTIADAEQLRAEAEALSGVEVISVIDGRSPAGKPPMCPPVLVVKANPARVAELTWSGQWLVEIDQPLLPPAYAGTGPLTVADPSLLATGSSQQVTVVVSDDGDQPVSGASVYLHGAWPAYAVTDTEGYAVLTVPDGCVDTATALIVTPAAQHWSRVIQLPDLTDGENTITVRSLTATFDGFPDRPHTGWGLDALRVGQLPPNYRGHGIKIALIDSGIAADHPDLTGRITHGTNLTDDPAGWDIDPLGTGTACAGIIAAADNDHGITGLAPDVEIHAVKTTPGGNLSTLLQAVDYCIEQRIDIAQLNVALPAGSQLLAAKLADARNAGIAIIAPAGDNPGPVGMPAVLPQVLTVTAIGRAGTYPPESTHATHLTGQRGPDGNELTVFTPVGFGTDLAAPGVAIVTTAAGGGYTVRDGTALAAAYITALAALILAHHDDFHTAWTHRGPDRADHLRRLLLTSCQPLGDPARTGAGLPDARRAVWRRRRQDTDWETAVLHQLNIDLTRAGLLTQPG